MALYIPHSIFHLARILYVRPETFEPCYVILCRDLCNETLEDAEGSPIVQFNGIIMEL